ncbi:solute carrier organic anion transporter family member 74D-like [Artemia franciscana]|uniref:solute carrier organic anion transporter family member 74D-like n=1 Tax=Artemia franciscana TaxID=6661 RepID=UPI0032DA4022
MASGLMFSGFIISKWKPRALTLRIWTVVMGFISFTCFIIFAFMKCSRRPLFGEAQFDGTVNVFNSCNDLCGCQDVKFQPICSSNGLLNFYSACHAGCRNFTFGEDGRKRFSDCTCGAKIGNLVTSDVTSVDSNGYGFMTEGYCVNDCYSLFLIYIVASAILKFLNSTTYIGNILVVFRCVKKEDKSVALGMGNFLTSLFGFIPGPIIYGALIDKTCILWREDCSKKGNCWMYDPDRFQKTLHLLTGCIFLLGTLCDLVLCWFVKDLDLYSEKENKDKKNGNSSDDD